jgi:hypothetical protein
MELIRSLAALACVTFAVAPAFAETIAYDCKVASTIIGGNVSRYDENLRSQPQLRLRLAVDVEAGKACRMMGDVCDPFFNVLKVEQKPTHIVASGTRVADNGLVQMTFFPERGQAIFSAGGVTTNTGAKDCTVVQSTVKLP